MIDGKWTTLPSLACNSKLTTIYGHTGDSAGWRHVVAINGVLSGLSIAHQFADVETIATGAPADFETSLIELLDQPAVSEAFILVTCNRAEYYVVTESPNTGEETLDEHVSDVSLPARRFLRHDEAIEHLFRVTAGLESQVLGEDEILGQFRDAYHLANDTNAIGPVLEPILLKALHVGERARSETEINEGVVSLASAAVTCAEEHVQLPEATVAVVGAGQTGERLVKDLDNRDVGTLYLLNRSRERALKLGESVAVDTIETLDELPQLLDQVDVCITATASQEPIITEGDIDPASTVVIDLGQPPDVDQTVRSTVEYYNLDRLRDITDRTHARRAEAAESVEQLVDDEIKELQRRFKREQAASVIARMRTGADRIKQHELERAKIRLEHGEAPPDEVLGDLAEALVNRLMAAPTEALRDAAEDDDWSTISAAIQIFDPDIDPDDLPEEIRHLQELATGD